VKKKERIQKGKSEYNIIEKANFKGTRIITFLFLRKQRGIQKNYSQELMSKIERSTQETNKAYKLEIKRHSITGKPKKKGQDSFFKRGTSR